MLSPIAVLRNAVWVGLECGLYRTCIGPEYGLPGCTVRCHFTWAVQGAAPWMPALPLLPLGRLSGKRFVVFQILLVVDAA
jgi:hypothetical protein